MSPLAVVMVILAVVAGLGAVAWLSRVGLKLAAVALAAAAVIAWVKPDVVGELMTKGRGAVHAQAAKARRVVGL